MRVGGRSLVLFMALASATFACVKISPEVKATFDAPQPSEPSHFRPLGHAIGPIVIPTVLPEPAAHPSASAAPAVADAGSFDASPMAAPTGTRATGRGDDAGGAAEVPSSSSDAGAEGGAR